MPVKNPANLLGPDTKTITRSELARLTFCNSKKLSLAISDGGIRKEWVGIGWVEDGKPHGDEVLLVEEMPKLTGRFGIVFPKSRQVILFGKRRLWEKKQEAEFHSAYVGEIGKDFSLDE